MSAPPSRAGTIGALVRKDLVALVRDRVWLVILPLSLGIFVAMFWLLPSRVGDAWTAGVSPPEVLAALEALGTGDESEEEPRAVNVVAFADADLLAAAVSGESEVEGARPLAGIAFPENFLAAVSGGEHATVVVYLGPGVPRGVDGLLVTAVREIAYAVRAAAAGQDPEQALPVRFPDESTIVLGKERASAPLPFRDTLRPLLVLLLLFTESLALAGLVAAEVSQRTVTALLVTPLSTADLLAAKGLTGALIALGQGLVFLVATASLGVNAALVLTALLIGAAMMSAVGLIAGSWGRDFMSTLFSGLSLLLPMMVPALAALLPGTPPLLVRLLPSHGLVEALVGAMTYGQGWSALAGSLAAAAGWTVVLGAVALVILKRRVEAL